MDDRIDLGESDGEGLIEPERVLDGLVFEGTGLLGARGAPDLEGEGLDPLGDLAAEDLDGSAPRARVAKPVCRAKSRPPSARKWRSGSRSKKGPFGCSVGRLS